MKVMYAALGILCLLFSCGSSDKIQGVYQGMFYESGDSAQGSVKVIPLDGETVGVAFNSPYGSFSGSGIRVTEESGNFALHMNTVTPYTNTIIYVNGFVNQNELEFDYTSSNYTSGSFKGIR